MSVRDELLAVWPLSTLDETNRKIVERAVDQLLDEHAHELAQKQRSEFYAREGRNFCVPEAADLIDPEGGK